MLLNMLSAREVCAEAFQLPDRKKRMKQGLHRRHLIFHGAVLLILGLLILDFLLRVIEWRAGREAPGVGERP